ncbi:MAG: preprotein translocase subunit SecG [Armatimonadota bacterium]|nr:preprotein translocase subunit SecG [Armatimonadota bacterium]
MTPIQIIMLVFLLLLSIALILLVMMQDTKSEGLTGNISNNMTPNFKGKPGFEEQMQTYTRYLVITWAVIGIVTAYLFRDYRG